MMLPDDPDPYGATFRGALANAGQAVAGLLGRWGAMASDAGSKAASLARSAMQATADAASATAQAAASGAGMLASKVGAVGLVGTEVAGLAALGVGGLGVARLAGVVGQVKAGIGAVKNAFSPHALVAVPCLPCLALQSAEMRKARIERRNALIAQAQASDDPAVRAAAGELKGDMKAVEMARLSENTYAQYDGKLTNEQKVPPEPWHAMTPQELDNAGLSPDLVTTSKAVVYTCPSDFPYDPKTVVAFRGTTGETEDILTDHDQALGQATTQYEASKKLGKQVGDLLPDAQVTGHSLGGGKAQVAAIAGGLTGEMFNSAGPHPNSVGLPADGLDQYAPRFIQYRSDGGLAQGGGDPLTGTQNSMTAQKAALAFVKGARGLVIANQWAAAELGIGDWNAGKVPDSQRELAGSLLNRVLKMTSEQAMKNLEFSNGKWYIPPALGEIRGVASKTSNGVDSGTPAQHSITNLVYGLEVRKSGDIQKMLDGTADPGPAVNYIGPMTLK